VAAQLHQHRSTMMLKRNIGLTKLYNIVFDVDCADTDVEELRILHTNPGSTDQVIELGG
jgi:hypothetical protein